MELKIYLKQYKTKISNFAHIWKSNLYSMTKDDLKVYDEVLSIIFVFATTTRYSYILIDFTGSLWLK